MPIKQIAEITGLSEKEIEALEKWIIKKNTKTQVISLYF